MSLRIGVLALQGAFAEHAAMLERLGAQAVELRQASDFSDKLDGIILPGGESTVMAKLLHKTGLFLPIYKALCAGMPVLGTCAGMILLAKQIEGEAASGFRMMDIIVKRNAYGRQLGSFHTTAACKGIGDIPMSFIRAPYVTRLLSPSVEVLSEVEGRIVAVQQGKMLATAFHPELTGDTRLHACFLSLCR